MATEQPDLVKRWGTAYPVDNTHMLNPKKLTAAQKKALWQGIKKLSPATAEQMIHDPIVNQLKDEFSAVIIFSIQEANQYITAGLEDKPHA